MAPEEVRNLLIENLSNGDAYYNAMSDRNQGREIERSRRAELSNEFYLKKKCDTKETVENFIQKAKNLKIVNDDIEYFSGLIVMADTNRYLTPIDYMKLLDFYKPYFARKVKNNSKFFASENFYFLELAKELRPLDHKEIFQIVSLYQNINLAAHQIHLNHPEYQEIRNRLIQILLKKLEFPFNTKKVVDNIYKDLLKLSGNDKEDENSLNKSKKEFLEYRASHFKGEGYLTEKLGLPKDISKLII